MKFAKCVVGLVLTLLAVDLQAAVAVQVAKTVDFSQFKTFAWRQGTPAPNPATETMIREAIQKQLLAKGLTRVESGADLLVLGSRGHGGFVGLVLGSVASAVVKHPPCPVVAVTASM